MKKLKNNPEFKKELKIEELQKEINEQQNNFNEMNSTIKNLIEINKIEFSNSVPPALFLVAGFWGRNYKL